MPNWVQTGGDIYPVPPTKSDLPGLPEHASATARYRRFFGQRKDRDARRRALSGLGVIDTDLCLWGESLSPEMQNSLYLVPALPTVKMKTGIYPQPYGDMAPSSGSGSGIVCTVNRWVASHPIWAGAGILAAVLLLGGGKAAAPKRQAKVRKRK